MSLFLVIGCVAPVDEPSEERGDVAIVEVRITRSAVVPTVHEVRFGTSVPGIGWVEVTDSAGTWQSLPSPSGTEHAIRLLGLKAGQTVDWRVVVEADGQRTEGPPNALDVPPAPAEMPAFEAQIPAEDGRRFWVLTYTVESAHSYAVIVDQDGDPVWWVTGENPEHQVAMAKPSLDGEAIWTGHFQGVPQGLRRTPIAAMSEDELTFRATVRAHHDFVERPDGGLAHLTHGYRMMDWGELGEQLVQIDQITEIAADGSSAVVFDLGLALSDQLSPPCRHATSGDWAHANSLVYDPTDDTYLLNLRNLDLLLKIARTTGSVVWQLGGLRSDFAVPPEDRFAHSHFSVWEDGRLYMFSNELHGGPSRLLQYTVDSEARTAELTWSYLQPDGRRVGVLGDLDPVPSGNRLAAWGALDTIEEISPDGTVVWRVAADDGTNLARATWIQDLNDLH